MRRGELDRRFQVKHNASSAWKRLRHANPFQQLVTHLARRDPPSIDARPGGDHIEEDPLGVVNVIRAELEFTVGFNRDSCHARE